MSGLLGESLLGFQVREPYPSELDYFNANPGIAGMAAEDNAITLNPVSPLTDQQRRAVAQNEAIRLWLRMRGVTPRFALTKEQQGIFAGTPYGAVGNEQAARDSILGRILSGDQSAGTISPDQQQWAEWLLRQVRSEGLL